MIDLIRQGCADNIHWDCTKGRYFVYESDDDIDFESFNEAERIMNEEYRQ